jgi:tetratricopeptide (TPR) repeat protein
VGIFLLPLLFLSAKQPWSFKIFSKLLTSPFSGLKTKFIFVFSTATLWLLKSASSFVGFVAGAANSTRAAGKKRFWVLAVGALLIGAVLLLRALGFAGPDQGATQWDRLSIWKAAVKVWAQDPLLGVGPGAFAGDFHLFEEPRGGGVSRYQMDAQVAHNEPLDWLAAFGIFGLLFGFFVLRHFWPRSPHDGKRGALTALSAASLFDFCFHTPLIVLQAAGLLTSASKSKASFSWPAGFLALGLAAGLFGAAAWVPSLLKQAADLEQAAQFPKALQCLDDAACLNAWDARVKAAQADFLERLYLATGDPAWKSRSDDAFDSVLALESADGQWTLKKARRCSARFNRKPDLDSAQAAETAWSQALLVLPLDAFAYFEEGLFLNQESRWQGKAAWGGRPQRAMLDFQKAAELEPNYASAWVNLGYCQKENPATRAQAKASFERALAVYERWKDADRVDPLEKEMVWLPPGLILRLEHEVSTP